MVTLEPCNHHGHTPPCRQGLIDAGVRRVVIAVIDPTSRGDGGAAELRRAGVDVEIGAGQLSSTVPVSAASGPANGPSMRSVWQDYSLMLPDAIRVAA